MKKIKNVSGEDRTVAPLDGRLVLAGQVIEVDDKDAKSYLSQESIWAEAPAKKGDN